MGDKWEGLLSVKTKEKLFAQLYARYKDASIANGDIEQYEKTREDFFINCWHMNQSESYLMWRVYADRGCAIQTTFERIQISFDRFKGEITGGVVEYIDFSRDEISVGNVFHSVVRKDLPYRDEREFRLLFWQASLPNQKFEAGPAGIRIKVELDKLTSNIWISPQFKGSLSEIERLVEEKKINCRILSSAVKEAGGADSRGGD
jgi:hypothetical protein